MSTVSRSVRRRRVLERPQRFPVEPVRGRPVALAELVVGLEERALAVLEELGADLLGLGRAGAGVLALLAEDLEPALPLRVGRGLLLRLAEAVLGELIARRRAGGVVARERLVAGREGGLRLVEVVERELG